MEPLSDLLGRGSLDEQGKRLFEIASRLLDRVSLACDVELGAESDVAIPLPLDQGRHAFHTFHRSIIADAVLAAVPSMVGTA